MTYDLQPGWSKEDDPSSRMAGMIPGPAETRLSERHGSSLMYDMAEFALRASPAPPSLSFQGPSIEEPDALDEVQGLDIGLDALDEFEDVEEIKTTSEDNEISDPNKALLGNLHDFDVPSSQFLLITFCDYSRPYSHSYEQYLEFSNFHGPHFRFRTYIKTLKPTKTARVKCPSCRWRWHRDFDVHDVRAHFIECPGEQFGFFSTDRAMSRFMSEDPPGPEIIDALRVQCLELGIAELQSQLPSAILFLAQLRPFCNGQLACIGPKCKGAQRFDASWGELKSHYKSYHTGNILPDENMRSRLDVEDHFAPHGKIIERLFAKARLRQEEWALMDNKTRAMEELRCMDRLEYECPTYRRLRRSPQFGVLKDLNKTFLSQHQQFHQLATESASADLTPFIDELRDKCPKLKDLRRLGTRTFSKVIQGTYPTTLLEIFAFISLSQAMASVMRSRGIRVDSDPGTIDYLAWRTCIENEAGRHLYDKILIAWFHPRWREDLQFGGSNPTPLSAQEVMKNFVLQLMKAKQINAAFNFSAFLRLDPLPKKQAHQGWTCAWWDENCECAASPVDDHPHEEEEDDPGDTSTKTLTNTVIFITASLFMIFIAALGVALLYLSNPRQRCYTLSANREEHVAPVYDVVLAAEKLKGRILNRLHQDPSIPALDDIVIAAEEALGSGYVWSVSDFHLHLEQVVQNHVKEPGLRSQLYAQIRHWCQQALDSVETICENHRGGCMLVPVLL